MHIVKFLQEGQSLQYVQQHFYLDRGAENVEKIKEKESPRAGKSISDKSGSGKCFAGERLVGKN